MLALRAIKELDFDHAMGKLSESDWKEMSSRLRARAARLIRQLDAGAGYREQIERDVAKRLAAADVQAAAAPAPVPVEHAETPDTRICAACSTANDPDARFCKSCGEKLGG
jgi:ribosomal protein L40E